jgi:hypothetical protein
VRAGGLPAASSAGHPLAWGVRADPRRGQQRAGWQQGGRGWADAVGGKGRLIFLSPPEIFLEDERRAAEPFFSFLAPHVIRSHEVRTVHRIRQVMDLYEP